MDLRKVKEVDEGNLDDNSPNVDSNISMPSGPPPPPPPAPPAPPSSLHGQIGKIPVSNKDLNAARKRLRKPERIVKQVNVERSDVFDKYKNYQYMPMVDSREYLRTLPAEIVSISLEGVEQLTDAFLISLYQCKLKLKTLSWMSLSGCYNVTDEGIFWLMKAFPTLTSLELSGCHKIKEKALYYILEQPNIVYLDLKGTGISRLPQKLPDKININIVGCPLISPPSKYIHSNGIIDTKVVPVVEQKIHKIVILCDDSLPCSPLAVLTDEADQKLQPGLSYKLGWSPLNGDPKQIFNVFQVCRGDQAKNLTELVVSNGSLVILPYHLTTSIDVDKVATQLTTVMSQIQTQYSECVFTLLGLTTEAGSYTDKMDALANEVRNKYKIRHDKLKAFLSHSIQYNWAMMALDFHNQEVFAAGEKIVKQGKGILPRKTAEDDGKDKNNDSASRLVTASLPVGGKVAGNQLKFLQDMVESSKSFFPWLNQPLLGDQVHKAADCLEKLRLPLQPLSGLVSAGLPDEIKTPFTERNPYKHLIEIVNIMCQWGKAFYYPILDERPVLTDVGFLCSVVKNLLLQDAPQKVTIRCFGQSVPCWTLADLQKACPGGNDPSTLSLVIKLLTKHGCLLRLPCDPWTTEVSVSSVYMLSDHLPASLPIALDEFWPADMPKNVTQTDRFFKFVPDLPVSFFPNLLRHCLKFGSPLMLWRTGCLIEKGPVTVLIERLEDSDGIPVVLVSSRIGYGKEASTNHHSYMQTSVMKLYTSIVSYLVQKYSIYTSQTIPCTVCFPTGNRHTIVKESAPDPMGLDQEHIVRESQKQYRKLSCHVCDTVIGTCRNISNDYPLSSLVPFHDVTGLDRPTANNFNRCLMCQQCGYDGMDCDVNLTEGIQSWHCLCLQRSNMCNKCGMCQRCFMSLMRMLTTISPCFEKPKLENLGQDQMIALDTVLVTVIGSMMGFTEDNTSHTLDQPMTPNYFPSLKITFTSDPYLEIQFKLEEVLLLYNTQTGFVVQDKDTKINTKDIERRVCKDGDVLTILLEYTEGHFTKMNLAMELNGLRVFSFITDAQEMMVTLTATSVMHIQKTFNSKRTFEEKKMVKSKKCGLKTQGLPCSIEMGMYELLETIEDIISSGRGLSVSGVANVVLPSNLTAETLKYPAFSRVTSQDVNHHFLCLSFNPRTGKKDMRFNKIRIRSMGDQSDPSSLTYLDNFDTWTLNPLVHLTNAEGIHESDLTTDRNVSFLLWAFHFIMISYPKVLLPDCTDRLLPNGICNEDTEKMVETGMRDLLRVGFWKYYLQTDMKSLFMMFAKTKHSKSSRDLIVTYCNDKLEEIQDNIESTGLHTIPSKFNATRILYMCPGHLKTIQGKQELEAIPSELFGVYGKFLSFVDLNHNRLQVIPDEFFLAVPNLCDFVVTSNDLEVIPATISNCKKLYNLAVTDNNLTGLPEELLQLKYLETLEIGCNMMTELPPIVTKLTSLVYLSATHLLLKELPEDFGNLVNLQRLYLIGNCLSSLPKSFTKLVKLEELGLNGIPLVKLGQGKKLSFEAFGFFLKGKNIQRWVNKHPESFQKFKKLFGERGKVLNQKEVGELNATLFNMFPRFGYKGIDPPGETTAIGFPEELLSCSKLRILQLNYQGFTSLPRDISRLEKLKELDLVGNPNLLSIPAELANITTLGKLDLDDCPLLKTPPKEIRDKGFGSTFAYLQRLLGGSQPCKRTKLMLVGLGGAGKTSLVRALLSGDKKANLTGAEDITDGIDIQTWNIKREEEQITYNVWDFAGQTVYYNTHQFFLSNRAVYLLLWNVRLGYEHAGLDFWLSSISVQAPNAPIFVVGSHVDQVSKFEIPAAELQAKYPQIAGFNFVSSFTGQGINDLQDELFKVTLQQEYMGEHIPAVWITFENNIACERQNHDVIEYKAVEEIAFRSGIFEPSEILQAVQFLHDLGSLQHFNNEFLKSRVVINQQWIVNVMACVVSVKQSVIKAGRLHHDDISELWKDYPKHIHFWLLRLTEEYDLTFPLSKETVNLVPCLLPEKKPEFTWPELEKGSDVKENMMIYKFDYLPAGLFNRGQVRLQDISDGSMIWKKGSFLRKNGHIALIQKVKNSELVVTVQGLRPENILFLVHEVFEGLIMESFRGITYDYMMPCPECSRMNLKDPHMFAASTIRRAIDLQAPFLQCVQYFHTISCITLLTLMPPDSHLDFDLHLIDMVQGLKDLKKDMCTDIFLSYCMKDVNLGEKGGISPVRVQSDLVNKGFKCWGDNTGITKTDEMAKALIDSSIFLAFVSSNYAEDLECVRIFKYARLTLQKPILVVAVGSGFDWKQSKLGILLSDEVFVNMTSAKLQHYESKFDELINSLQSRTNIQTEVSLMPLCFISYSWVNSLSAVNLGTRSLPGAVGHGDPRKLKDFLEENAINCWIDIERVGMNGLFDDIAEGLLSAKVVVVCVSDEYASSPTCQIEFRYAANTLKLPIIMVVVGTGDQWRATEVGLLSVNYPIVNMQEHSKTAKKKLIQLVQDKLANSAQGEDTEAVKVAKEKANEEHKNMSYQELFELAQRKLIRQLTMFSENHDAGVYPRLFLIDFVRDEVPTSSEETDASSTYNYTRDDENFSDDESEEEDLVPVTLNKKKVLKKRSTLQPHKLVKKHTSVVHPLYKLQKFCVYILCEHDEGWHIASEPLMLPEDFGLTMLDDFSPYLARITAVMKYSKTVVMACQEDEIGQSYIKWLDESPEAAVSDYQDVYHKVREMVIKADTLEVHGCLARCHLPNGRTTWLCTKHRRDMRLTILGDDDQEVRVSKDIDDQTSNAMLNTLRSFTKESFTDILSIFTDTVKSKRVSNPVKTGPRVESHERRPKVKTGPRVESHERRPKGNKNKKKSRKNQDFTYSKSVTAPSANDKQQDDKAADEGKDKVVTKVTEDEVAEATETLDLNIFEEPQDTKPSTNKEQSNGQREEKTESVVSAVKRPSTAGAYLSQDKRKSDKDVQSKDLGKEKAKAGKSTQEPVTPPLPHLHASPPVTASTTKHEMPLGMRQLSRTKSAPTKPQSRACVVS